MPGTSAVQSPPPIVGVIDPDPVARNGLRALLHRLGVDVSTFESAESYLLAANGRNLACLMLRRLRSAGNDVPFMLLADESDVPTAVAAMREGATDFIEKPYVDVAVLKQVQKLLHRPPDAAHA